MLLFLTVWFHLRNNYYICNHETSLTKILNTMKKLIVIVALMLGIAVAASAQPRALGLRGGAWASELSYQHSLGENFLEVDLGWWYSGGLNVAAAYAFSIAPLGPFNFYAGPAADVYTYKYVNDNLDEAMGLGLGIGAQIGIEYIFDEIPFQISLDWRPMFNILHAPGAGAFGYEGIALGLRYAF